MHCCHSHARPLETDPRFADDDFTQNALRERRARAAHAHGGALLLSVLGSMLFLGMLKRIHHRVR